MSRHGSSAPGMRWSLLLGAVLLLGLGAPAVAQSPGGSQAVVLIHHPYDKVDPFGVPFGDGDTFSARHLAISTEGRFDFPTFVADGVSPASALPDPAAPYAGTLANYTALFQERLRSAAPGTLVLRGDLQDGALSARVRFEPVAPLSDPQNPEALHMLVAVVEDFIHYEPDPRVSNGVTEHRFTVRALRDLGAVDLSSGSPVERTEIFAVPSDWARDHLLVAAWLESGAAFGRFRPGEVLQAAWAKADGTEVRQVGKAVLLEVYSATWCDPCLYGDMAAEKLAVDYGSAAPAAKAAGPRYLKAPETPAAGAILAVVAGLGLVAWQWRRRPA